MWNIQSKYRWPQLLPVVLLWLSWHETLLLPTTITSNNNVMKNGIRLWTSAFVPVVVPITTTTRKRISNPNYDGRTFLQHVNQKRQQPSSSSSSSNIQKSVHFMAQYTSDPLPTNTDDIDNIDVIVIGSGLAGLSCAALLSHCHKRVVVLE